MRTIIMSGVLYKVSRDYHILRSARITIIIRIFASECHEEAAKDQRERRNRAGEMSSDGGESDKVSDSLFNSLLAKLIALLFP